MDDMKITTTFSKKSPEDIRILWSKLNHLKNRLESKLDRDFILKIDPINETFQLIPIQDSFSFEFPVSYGFDQDIIQLDLIQ